jgi:glycine/D-amino acid oxidase-like deaminating enzyme
MKTVWETTASDTDRRALDPGVADELDRTPDVLVVGGGAAGLSAAVMSVRTGLGRVLLLERDRLAGGPTGMALGGFNPGIHALLNRPPEFVSLCREGLDLYRQLDAEWSGALGVRTADTLVATEVLPPHELLERAAGEAMDIDVARKIEPQLTPEIPYAILLRDQALGHPLHMAAEMSRHAGQLASGVTMTAIDTAGERVTRVRTSHGDISPGALVIAVGAAVPEWGPVPHVPVKGHILVTEPASFRLRALLAHYTGVYQLPDGRLLAGATFEPNDRSLDLREEQIAWIREEMERMVPAAHGLEVEFRWCCFRPGTPDDMPVIDRIPGTDNAWVSAGHFRTGLLVGPAGGLAIAEWIGTGRRPNAVSTFGLDRFGK